MGVGNRESEVTGLGTYQVVQCWGDCVADPMKLPGEPKKFISKWATQEMKGDTFVYHFLNPCGSTVAHGG